MTPKSLLSFLLIGLTVAMLWRVLAEGHQISEMRAEQKRLDAGKSVIATTTVAETVTTPSSAPNVPRELLQLRAEVAQLSQQQRELASSRSENERLRRQLEN